MNAKETCADSIPSPNVLTESQLLYPISQSANPAKVAAMASSHGVKKNSTKN
jgi:hypothetical protein